MSIAEIRKILENLPVSEPKVVATPIITDEKVFACCLFFITLLIIGCGVVVYLIYLFPRIMAVLFSFLSIVAIIAVAAYCLFYDRSFGEHPLIIILLPFIIFGIIVWLIAYFLWYLPVPIIVPAVIILCVADQISSSTVGLSILFTIYWLVRNAIG